VGNACCKYRPAAYYGGQAADFRSLPLLPELRVPISFQLVGLEFLALVLLAC